MTRKQIDHLVDVYPDLDFFKIDGFDSCCVGVVSQHNMRNVLAYDVNKILKKLVKEGMTREEAIEFFNFNIGGAYLGTGTPAFIYR